MNVTTGWSTFHETLLSANILSSFLHVLSNVFHHFHAVRFLWHYFHYQHGHHLSTSSESFDFICIQLQSLMIWSPNLVHLFNMLQQHVLPVPLKTQPPAQLFGGDAYHSGYVSSFTQVKRIHNPPVGRVVECVCVCG